MRKLFFNLTLMICLIVSPIVTSAATIIVDAGHGGKDPGAIGVTGLQEKEVNFDIAQKLEAELIAKGHNVFMIREDDVYISLEDRIKIAREQSADLFISIHANSFPNEEPHGALILYYDDAHPQKNYPASKEMKQLTPQSKQLATDVLDQFITQTGLYNRGIVPSSVYVVRMGNVPSILIETAFLSNKSDEKKLKDATMRETMAKSLADGIEQYLLQHNPFVDVRNHWAAEHIMKLHQQGIIHGMSANTYGPERSLTRAEWMTMLERMIPERTEELLDLTSESDRLTDESTEEITLPFSDINEEHWAYTTLVKLYSEGLLDGFPDGTLRPDLQITRAEVSSMLNRVSPIEVDPVVVSDYQVFSDVPEKHWAFSAIQTLKQSKVIVGDKHGMFHPDQAMTRAEISAVIDRYLEQF